MKIAGTSFEICDLQTVWSELVLRIARSTSPMEVLDEAYIAAENESAVSMLCSDGLVIMTLKCYPDGTMAAVVLMAASFGRAGAFERQQDDMMAVARAAGADSLTFRSDRKGWGRMLGAEWSQNGEFFSRSL